MPPPFGIYIHFPYCAVQCPYCDFAVSIERDVPSERYADAVIAELALRAPAFNGLEAVSLFIGGGTPSLWAPDALRRVIASVRARFRLPESAEITLEANPESVAPAQLKAYRDAGVNRLSIGVQSFDDAILRKLGRRHSGSDAVRAVRDALLVFENVSIDLIYGARRTTVESARADAAQAISLSVPHVSAYVLTLENLAVDVPLARLKRTGRLPLPTDSAICDQGAAIRGILRKEGLRRYEVSNFARPGFESRHNGLYWAGAAYLGVGVGAFGFHRLGDRGVRYGNYRSPRLWFEALAAEHLPTAEEESLTREQLDRERIMLALRTVKGLSTGALPAEKSYEVQALIEAGLLKRRGDYFALSARGFDVHTAVAERLC